jgi:hypothetical protein
MIIKQKCKSTITTYLEKHMVYCPGCNKRFRSDNRPVCIAELTTSQTGYLFLLDNDCSSDFFGSRDKRRNVITARIEKRMQEQPDIYCPEELREILQPCIRGEDEKPEMRIEIGDPEWKVSDRNWFLDNPGRAHRLRRRFPGEDGDPADWIIIRCLIPGARMRIPVPFIKADRAALLGNNEDALHRFFDLAHDLNFGKITYETADLHVHALLNGLKPDGNNVKAK